MSWKYRDNETDQTWGDGAPSGATGNPRPVTYLDRLTGASYFNLGAGSTTWYQTSGGTLASVGNASTILAAAKTVTVADHGADFFLAAAGGFAITLPTAAAALRGLRFRCFVQVAPTTAYTIVTGNSAEQLMAGKVWASDGSDEDSEDAFTGTTLTFVANTALIGDWCEIVSAGATGWIASGFCKATGGITVTG